MPQTTRFERTNVVGFLHEPIAAVRGGIALTHGAGGNSKASLLVKLAEACSERGWMVLRYDLAFRVKRAYGPPPRYSAGEDQAAIRSAVEELRSIVKGPTLAGGHSYGGRQTTIIAAKEPELCDGLVLLSYPLHPPQKKTELRTAHFPQLHVNSLFVQGSTDPFATIPEMEQALKLVPAQKKLVVLEGAGHDLNAKRFDVGTFVASAIDEFFR